MSLSTWKHDTPSWTALLADQQDSSVIPTAALSGGGADNNALVLFLGGWAIASGDNSLTDGEIHTSARDLGQVTVATGDATFIGAASGNQAVADANTFADVSGADIAIIRTIQSGPTFGSNGTVSSTSETQATAIDFHNFDFPGGPLVVDLTLQAPWLSQGNQFALLGHLATVTADAQAFGANSISDTQTFAATDLIADNPFSFVSGLAISGVA